LGTFGGLASALIAPRGGATVFPDAAIDSYKQLGTIETISVFIGYEWSSNFKGNKLHRVVIFRDNVDKASQTLPLSLVDNPAPESLWKGLDAYEDKTGGFVRCWPSSTTTT
jgi:Protein of unknown function (DUF3604)